MTHFDFLKTLTKDVKVAALVPSSQYVIRRMVKEIPEGTRFVVEYGAGDGVITKELLKLLPPDGKLVAIELNNDFISELNVINDPRLIIVGGDVVRHSETLDAFGLPRIDLVISGIPFSLLKPEERRIIIKNTHRHLTNGGMFLIYQFTLLIYPILKKVFKATEWRFELRNLPPYFIMVGRK